MKRQSTTHAVVRGLSFALICLLVIAAGFVSSGGEAHDAPFLPPDDAGVSASAPGQPARRLCPPSPAPRVVEIREANPQVNKQHHDAMRDLLVRSVSVANTTVLLGPDVVLDFSDARNDDLPLSFGPCVTLTSTTNFRPVLDPSPAGRAGRSARRGARGRADAPVGAGITNVGQRPPARTPSSLGPLLKFGPHRGGGETIFLSIECRATHQPNDNVRISGFRLHGPSFGHQTVEDIGVFIFRCLNIEVSNMEIAGWGGQGVHVGDDFEQDQGRGPGQEQPDNHEGERIGRPEQIRIFNNYIHHNQRPRGILDNHAAGYGVAVHHGAWAQVYQNVFDFNRHAIAAAGDTGGYEALRNLVLKGGGVHFEPLNIRTHQFDIHGTGDNGFGGQATVRTLYAQNSFQYLAGPAIKVRGRPHQRVDIHDNVFAHEGLEHDDGDDAVHVEDRDDLDVIKLGPNNVINFDSYGRYGVCDFDGDGVDDLFLATGKTWWFSSFGEFQWTYLSDRTERLSQVRLGYFDEDVRCDVLTESDGEWVVASGGTGPWRSIGRFGAPLSEVAFGRFDPHSPDLRPGATRRTTHAFRRLSNGQWQVTMLAAPAWRDAQSSSFPMSSLRFGDFTGDGVTDVLAVQGGRWSVSRSAAGSWERLNQHLSDDVKSLFITDLNHNNIDDLIKLERSVLGTPVGLVERFTWWVSDDGRSRWRKLKTYLFLAASPPAFGYAGRFGAAPGGGLLLIDHGRIGRFHSPAEVAAGAPPDWSSLFAY